MKKDLLEGGYEQAVQRKSELSSQQKQKKRKNIFIAIAVAFVIVLAVIIFLVVKKNNDDPNPPGPGPEPDDNNPLSYQEYNPFLVTDNDFQKQDWYFNGVLKNSLEQNQDHEQNLRFLGQVYPKLQKQTINDTESIVYKPVDPKLIPTGEGNKMMPEVHFNFSLVSNYEARLQIGAKDGNNFSVSNETYNRPVQEFEARFTQLGFSLAQSGSPFSWNITNIFNGESVISTKNRKMVIQEKFSEIGMVLPNDKIFGLGLSNRKLRVSTNSTYTLWSKGRQEEMMPKDLGMGGQGSAQVHPFLLGQTNNKQDWYGIFFVSGAPQSFEVIQVPGKSQVILNYITLTDSIEMYIMMRGSPQAIIKRYQHDIQFPSLPPYYALGVYATNQMKSKFSTSDGILELQKKYSSSNINVEGFVVDQYTQNNCPFVESFTFGDVSDLHDTLKKSNQRMILSIQSGIPTDKDSCLQFNKFKNSLIANLSIQDDTKYDIATFRYFSTNDKPINIGYLDIFNNETSYAVLNDAFTNDLKKFAQDFDGIYLRANTPFSQRNGSEKSEVRLTAQNDKSPQIFENLKVQNPEDIGTYEGYKIAKNNSVYSYENLPFEPGYDQGGDLDNHTIDLGLIHQGFKDRHPSHAEGVAHLNVHNLYGFEYTRTVWQILKNLNKPNRPNVYSESTWAGSGFYGGSWNQPLELSYESVKNSVAMAMTMGINGVNNWITEVCGYDLIDPKNQTQADICKTWMEVAAFLPMVSIAGPVTEEISSDPASLFKDFNTALNQRLPFTRYIYSQMYAANYTGGSLVYPLYFDFSDQEEALAYVEETFMLGDAIKVTPYIPKPQMNKLTEGETYEAYFPQGNWYDLNDYKTSINSTDNKTLFNLTYTSGQTNVYLKEGKILPFQAKGSSTETTKDYEKKPITLVVNRDESHYAEGYLLSDDGISQDNFKDNKFTFWKFRFAEKAINFWVERGDFTYNSNQKIDALEKIEILGAHDLNDTTNACYFGTQIQPQTLDVLFDNNTNVLSISVPAGQSVSFQKLGFIKFLNNKTEANICSRDGFKYTAVKDDNSSNSTYLQFNVAPNALNLDQLVATFTLLDNEGTIQYNLTTVDDFNKVQGKQKFRAPHVQNYTGYTEKMGGVDPKQDINDYIQVSLSPFSFKLLEDQQVIYAQTEDQLYFSDFMVFDSGIFDMNGDNDNPLMGMGERAGELFFKNENGGIHSRWSHDAANPIDDGKPPGRNMYGFQPFYQYQLPNTFTQDWIGVFNNNPFGTDYIVNTNKGKQANITTVTIGGAIEKYFFRGKKPDDLIRKYEFLTGMPTVPPLWAFGWQQCRFGWVTDQIWQEVVDNYTAANLPLDTMWADIDYMDDYKIFTVSDSRYSNLSKQVKAIRAQNKTFVPIMDAGVAVRSDDYYALQQGIERKIFIKQAESDEPLTAGVWCGDAYFPDFYNEDAVQWWSDMFSWWAKTYDLEFDGIWLDMNEATNFCDGYCKPEERPKKSLRNQPFYIPGQRDLETASLGVDGRHQGNLTEYEVHNTFSLMQVRATALYLQNEKKLRPYILSRSNFQGLQKFGYHWLGDNWSWTEYMVASVKNIYEYQLFGLPFMGCDLCGFNGDAPADLCTRWHQVGNLFPFARNHNQNATAPQEPYRFNYPVVTMTDNTTYTDLIRTAIQNRYTLLRYYYSAFWEIQENGGSFFKPLFFEFTKDPKAYDQIEKNMLLGNGLKASVETTNLADSDSVNFYFPSGTWCQVIPFIETDYSSCIKTTTGLNVSKRSHLQDYYVHARNGYIIPLQNATDPNGPKIITTKDQYDQKTDLFVVPNDVNTQQTSQFGKRITSLLDSDPSAATGFIYFDDGVTIDSIQEYSKISFAYSYVNSQSGQTNQNSQLLFSIDQNKYQSNKTNEKVGNIIIANPMADLEVDLNHVLNSVKATINIGTSDPQVVEIKTEYDPKVRMLTIAIPEDVDFQDQKYPINFFTLQKVEIEFKTNQ